MEENRKPTQAERVLAYLHRHGTITQLEALLDLGVMRLASRISELKATQGIRIFSRYITVENRFGEKCSVKEYRLTEEVQG